MSEVELLFTTTAGWQQYLPLKREENMLDVIASDHDIRTIAEQHERRHKV